MRKSTWRTNGSLPLPLIKSAPVVLPMDPPHCIPRNAVGLVPSGRARSNDQKSGKLMAGDDKKSAPKAAPKEKTAVEPKGQTPAEAPVEAKTETKAEASRNYSRGE